MNRNPNIPKAIQPEERFLVTMRMLLKDYAIAIDNAETKIKELEERIVALEAKP